MSSTVFDLFWLLFKFSLKYYQCRTHTYFATVRTVWAPKLSAQRIFFKDIKKPVNSLII